jgi:hypothetical protein
LSAAESRLQAVLLQQRAAAPADFTCLGARVEPEDLGPALVRIEQPQEQADRGRLARAIWTQEAKDYAPFNFQ